MASRSTPPFETGLSIAGTSDGLRSPVPTFSDMVYADILLAPGARYRVKPEHIERAIYVIEGEVSVDRQTGGFAPHGLVVLKPGAEIVLRADGGAADADGRRGFS